MVVQFLILEGTSVLFSIVAVPIYISTNSVPGFPFLLLLTNIVIFFFSFLVGVTLTGLKWYLILALTCISLIISGGQHLFIYLLTIVCLLCWNIYSIPLPIFNCVICFCCCWVMGAPYVVWILTLYQTYGLQIFHSVGCLSFCWLFPLLCTDFLIWHDTCLFLLLLPMRVFI